jgi:hypothetical protein
MSIRSLKNTSVRGATILPGSVTAEKITNNAVTTAKIADANVTLAKLATDAVDAFAPRLLTEGTAQTSNYTIALADINRVVLMNGSGLTLSIPLNSTTAFPIGSVVNVYNVNSTDLTIAGVSGVTLRNAGALAQYGEISLRKRGTDEWVLAGNVS